jgi:hypothetical protein
MSENLEFIQMTRSVEFTLDSSSIASLSGEASSTPVEIVRQIDCFYKKQTQFFTIFHPKTTIPPKNKANSNPIQSQTNPILAQKSGGQTQTNPISNAENER